MALLVKADLLRYIDLSTLDQLTGGNDTYVDEAISDAETRVREKISPRFDLDAEFAKVGAARNQSLVKHAIGLSIYYLFQRLYTNVLPEGRVEAYDMAEAWLTDVYEGRITVEMDKKDEANEQGWPLRWGSKTLKGSQNW